MQVTETSAEGLFRAFKVTIPNSELDEKLNLRLDGLKDKVNLKGFRPGKVPMDHLKKTFGAQVMGEILEETLTESSQKALEERSLRAALQPKIEFNQTADDLMTEGKDLEFSFEVELMPDFELMDVKGIAIDRLTAEITDKEIDDQVGNVAESQLTYSDLGEDAVAADGNQLMIDFDGSIDGLAFDGGRAEGMALVLGSGQFIPGFEEQLVGQKAGAELDVVVPFPEDYPVEDLAGKEATFAVKIHAVNGADEIVIDDDFAKKVGMDDLAALKDAIRGRMKQEFDGATRAHSKRSLLDALDKGHAFDLPKGMVDAEFQAIWQQVIQDLQTRGKTIEDEAESEEDMKKEYKAIAERRVRLGLVLAEIGKENNIDVTQEEMGRALSQLSRQYPGQEKQIYEYYQQNMGAMAQLRAPIFEDKVVDFILELVTITDKVVDREELFADPYEDVEVV